MATITLRPNGNGDVNSCEWLTHGSNHWEEVNDIVSDDDGSYVAVDGNLGFCSELYTIESNSLLISDVISQIEIFINIKSEGAKFGDSTFTTYIKENSTYTIGNTYFSSVGNYSTFSNIYTTRPSDSLTWTKTDIDNLQIGVYSNNDGPGSSYCTQVYVVVTYTSSGGSSQPIKPVFLMLETDD